MNVIILAAGAGIRVKGLGFPKPLLLVDEVPLITHVMRACPDGSRFFVAINSEDSLLRDYLSSQDEFSVTLVDVGMPSDPGAGPGTSLRKVLETVRAPALFCVADGLFSMPAALPAGNWLAVGRVTNSHDYCCVSIRNGHVATAEKQASLGPEWLAWIGVGYVEAWQEFLGNLETARETGERQCSSGWRTGSWALVEFHWVDLGTRQKYEDFLAQRSDYRKPNAFALVGRGRVVKVMPSEEAAINFQVRRESIGSMAPPQVHRRGRVIAYDFIPGRNFYCSATPERFEHLLRQLSSDLWRTSFRHGTMNLADFYKTKTLQRATLFSKGRLDLLGRIDWSAFSSGIKANVHGDLQFDNIIVSDQGQVRLIDWRSDFGGDTRGDLYYDLAKLLSGIWVDISKARGKVFAPIENFDAYVGVFKAFHQEHRLDWTRTQVLAATCLISMAGIHAEPYASAFYALGVGHLKELT